MRSRRQISKYGLTLLRTNLAVLGVFIIAGLWVQFVNIQSGQGQSLVPQVKHEVNHFVSNFPNEQLLAKTAPDSLSPVYLDQLHVSTVPEMNLAPNLFPLLAFKSPQKAPRSYIKTGYLNALTQPFAQPAVL